jgi:hypothetical protein
MMDKDIRKTIAAGKRLQRGFDEMGVGRSQELELDQQTEQQIDACIKAALILYDAPRRGRTMALAWDCLATAAVLAGKTVDEFIAWLNEHPPE